jgi:16S rRNA (cytosine967-C5)-methyltransferase
MAERMHNEGFLLAQDVTPERLKLIEQNCDRLGITCVRTVGAQNEQSTPTPLGLTQASLSGMRFDRILVDAPCSNTGVMRRRVDLRWRIQLSEIKRLRALQLNLLARAAAMVKTNGCLIYSTCSLEQEENQAVVTAFLERHSEFKLERELELRPFVDGVDGAYVARLRRSA